MGKDLVDIISGGYNGKCPLNFSINSIIAGILGISTDQVRYIWYGLTVNFLLITWKIYKMFQKKIFNNNNE